MTRPQTNPTNIADRKAQAEADAALDQMFGYFTRDEIAPAQADASLRRAA